MARSSQLKEMSQISSRLASGSLVPLTGSQSRMSRTTVMRLSSRLSGVRSRTRTRSKTDRLMRKKPETSLKDVSQSRKKREELDRKADSQNFLLENSSPLANGSARTSQIAPLRMKILKKPGMPSRTCQKPQDGPRKSQEKFLSTA